MCSKINIFKVKQVIAFFLLIFINFSYVFSSYSWNEDIFQQSVDNHFGKIDKKIEIYLNNLNKEKNHCFWKDKKQNFVECIDEIEKNFDNYTIEYNNSCIKILKETIDKWEYISSLEAQKFIDNKKWTNLCTELYDFKIKIYRWVAYDILKKNKYQILKDENKLFTQEQRKKYDKLLDLIRINLWYIERLWKKWPSKTK